MRTALARSAFVIAVAPALLNGRVLAAGQQDLTTLSGTVFDQVGGRMAGVEITVKDGTGQSRQIRSDDSGRYTIADMADGTYVVRASSPGFSPVLEDITVGPHTRTRDITLRIRRAAEVLTVAIRGRATGPQPTRRSAVRFSNASEPTCTTRFPDTGIGGELKMPTKTKNQAPAYPGSLAANPMPGDATVAGVIGTDGKTQSVVVLKTSRPEFGEELLQSVRAWEFFPARVNCVAVNMIFTVTAHFVVEP